MNDFFNLRKRGLFLLEGFKEIFKICFFLRFNMYFYTKANVFDPAFIVKLMGQPVDKRPEANSLDYPKNHHLSSISLWSFCHILSFHSLFIFCFCRGFIYKAHHF